MQAARYFIALGIEFAAGVQLGHYHLSGRNTLFFVQIDGNTAAIIDYGDGIVVVNGDVDFVAIAGQGFIHGIVHNFINQVVQSHFASGPDIHGRPQPDCFQALQHFDASGIVDFALNRRLHRLP